MKHLIALFIAAAAARGALAGPAVYRWLAETARPAAQTIDVFQGETMHLEPTILEYGVAASLGAGTAVTLWWQTNGMGQAWWSVPGVTSTVAGQVRATFAPSNDVGAARYTFFVQAADPDGSNYRAYGTLIMRFSPGYSPVVAPPLQYQWVSPAEMQSVSNALAAALQAEAATRAAADAALTASNASASAAIAAEALLRADGDAARPTHAAATNLVAALVPTLTAAEARRLVAGDTNSWVAVEGGTNWLYTLTHHGEAVYVASASDEYNGPAVGTVFYPKNDGIYGAGVPCVDIADASMSLSMGDGGWMAYLASFWQYPVTLTYVAGGEPAYAGTVTIDLMADFVATNAYRIATEDYVATAIQTYFLSSNAWITITNNVLSVHAVTGGASQASIVWSSAESDGSQGIDADATNLLWQALSAGLNEKADKAWGKYGPDGSTNPDASYQTWLNAPATAFGGGLQWATDGTYAVLATAGAVAFVSDHGGEVRIGIDLYTNYIGFAQGQSITVGARAESIQVVGGGTPEGHATIVYDYESGDFPVMWMCLALSDTWQAIDEGVIWVDNGDGSATVTVPATSGTAFYMATTSRNLSCVVFSKPPFRFDGGILGATNALPVVYDSIITISSGGKQYLIPAQEAP